MSPEQAVNHWCPFARAAVPVIDEHSAEVIGAISANRISRSPMQHGGTPDKDCMCIADRCMAWRWLIHPSLKKVPVPDGYCGLAGQETKHD